MNILKKLSRYFKDEDFRIYVNTKLGFYKNMSDEDYLKKLFKANMGYELNLENPRTFNEKLQWLKLYDHRPEYTIMVDKFLVKEYVADKIGSQYVIPLLGVWKMAEDINFEDLPNSFVLKCNHNSGNVIICRDKNYFDTANARKILGNALKEDFYVYGKEWPYKNVKKRILAEKYIFDETSENGLDLPDYKVMCFDGKVKAVQVHKGRFLGKHTQEWYDADWNMMYFKRPGQDRDFSKIERPVFLDKMIELSEILSEGIPEIRVDWYYANNRLYFGELTFFEDSGLIGFDPPEFDEKLGNMITLPEKRQS